MSRHQILTFFLFAIATKIFAQTADLTSPSGNISVKVQVSDSLYYTIHVHGSSVIEKGTMAMLTSHVQAGIKPGQPKVVKRSVNEMIVNPVPYKRKNIPDRYNEMTLTFKDKYALEFRAYDDGVAYRFVTSFHDSITISNEIANFRFSTADTLYIPVIQKRDNADIFLTSFEELYTKAPVDQIHSDQVGFSPVLMYGKVKALITESDLYDYPGMFLRGTASKNLKGLFAGYPDREEVQGGEFKQWVVLSRKNYIARTEGTRAFPWRVIALTKNDGDLLLNDIVYRLGRPSKINDWSWVKPGMSTEEWIIGSNIYGVEFKAGINTETYKYYIDFASRFGMQYVMLDAGWSSADDLFAITKGIDLEAISSYAKEKNIGLVMWTLAMTLDRQLDDAMKMFSKLGLKVVMTDFMDRDDQKMVRFYYRIAEAAAKNKMGVMFHGAFKNAGFERTFPNAIAREAILGSEYNIWSDKASPEHDLQIPFIRMVSGPMDYEPGFMVNASQKMFRPLPDKVMSQGTRCHQLAMFVAYESPLQLFSGNPADAYNEVNFTTYLASLPTTWDDIVVLDAKVGDYLIVARRKDQDWYVAAMTDWTPRTFEIDLSFLGKGDYRAFTAEDGINAPHHSSDYRMGYALVNASKKLKINMASGGGYVAKLIKLYDARP